jgi:hypothetical protein
MSILKFSFVLIVFLVFASQFFTPITLAEVSKDRAASAYQAVSKAEENVTSAYQAVSKAEESGANVSGLLIRLNEAGWFLSRAQIAYKYGNFDSALKFANQSQEELNGFVVEANVLKARAVNARYWDFTVNVVGSITGSVAVACCSVVVWVLLKRRYR